MTRIAALGIICVLLSSSSSIAQQGSGQDDKILERGESLLEEAKAAYEDARSKNSVAAFVDAGFKLEEARIKFIVLQEIGTPDKQKVASDRLRAINQLGKLIHDGKVAISGTSADEAAIKETNPSVPPPAVDPGAKSAMPAPKVSVDVSKRAAVPDPAKQREAEKQIKALFKDQYSKKSPEDRKALARMLLDQAAKSGDDPNAEWVLLREAQDAATQACDVKLLTEAIDISAQMFDVDYLSMKYTGLTAIGKVAKAPEECRSLTLGLLRLIDDLVAADQYDVAEKAVASSVLNARKTNNAMLTSRAATRSKEIAEMKTLYQGMKSVLATLAKSPEDPAANSEMGKFLCYVKGNWDLGLRFAVKGSDATIKPLADKELAQPTEVAGRVALADGWWDLADKEKSPLRKSQLILHARGLYESVLPDTSALVRARIEKRLDESGATPFAALTDTLNHLDNWVPEKGVWTQTDAGIKGVGESMLKFQQAFPKDFVLEVQLNVVDGMRPRIRFDAGKVIFANEGFDHTLYIYGDGALDIQGTPAPYRNNKSMSVKIAFQGEAITLWVDGKQCAKAKRGLPAADLRLSIQAGDSWSKGTCVFSKFSVSR
jgi:hypothetical protein